MKLVLASKSPRRYDLLKSQGFKVVVLPCLESEPPYDCKEKIEDYVKALAYFKARFVAQNIPQEIVLGADTIIEFNGEVIGKPKNYEHYLEIMHKLSGKEHKVHTAYALCYMSHVIANVVTSVVKMKDLTDEDIEAYWQTGEPKDKAGGYGIQGKGANLIATYQGDLSSIIGLPIKDVMHDIEVLQDRFK